MELIEGDPARAGRSYEGSGKNSLPHRESGIAPRAIEPPTTGSGGKIQEQLQGQRRAGLRTQQAVAIVNKCHTAEHGTLAEAI